MGRRYQPTLRRNQTKDQAVQVRGRPLAKSAGTKHRGKQTRAQGKRGRSHALPPQRFRRPPQSSDTAAEDVVFQVDIDSIASMEFAEFPTIINRARRDIDAQVPVIEACLCNILRRTYPTRHPAPRYEQVRCLRRLIFLQGDTLLVARTGFGKSLIFQAYSILTSKITIHIVPLNKLAEEQCADVAKLDGTFPVLINGENRKRDSAIISKLASCTYTHILLGPEQAASKDFRDALKDQMLQSRIGLVAIDECHLVKQWGLNFRAAFAQINDLRGLLRESVVWFGCTATLDIESEQLVLEKAGFRTVGSGPEETELFRTSINRNDLFLNVLPIPRDMKTTWAPLFFLLRDAINPDSGELTPEKIPKTIVFIDSIAEVGRMAQCFQGWLLEITKGKQVAYSREGTGPTNVQNIIKTFNARISDYDRSKRYATFAKEDSIIRIIVATTSLGMGVNVPDVDQVVIWGFPLDKQIADLWQRVGRGGRGENRRSTAYVFLPYWAFDDQGFAAPDIQLAPLSTEQPQRERVGRNRSRQDRGIIAAGAVGSDVESNAEDKGDTEVSSIANPSIKQWSPADHKARLNLPPVWREVCNAPCKRKPILTFLGEDQLPEDWARVRIEHPDDCCNGCSPLRSPPLLLPPPILCDIQRPMPTTRSGIALGFLEEWVKDCIAKLYSNPNRRFPIPAGLFIPCRVLWEVAYLFKHKHELTEDNWDTMTLAKLRLQAPLLSTWEKIATWGPSLVERLKSIRGEITVQKAKLLAMKKARGKTAVPATPVGPASGATSVQIMEQGDRNLARSVQLREARTTHLPKSTLSQVMTLPVTPEHQRIIDNDRERQQLSMSLTQQSPSVAAAFRLAAESRVFLSKSPSLSFLSPETNSISHANTSTLVEIANSQLDIETQQQSQVSPVFNDPNVLVQDSQSTSPSIVLDSQPSTSQGFLVPDSFPPAPVSNTCPVTPLQVPSSGLKRRQASTANTPSKRSQVLAPRTPNRTLQLKGELSISKYGRVRKASAKEKENY